MRGIPEECKNCHHFKTDHDERTTVHNKIVTKRWYGECEKFDSGVLCMCEEFKN